ncbi:hypothetical protein E4U19_007548 [Claviceps sp. Clav32 group G5]|nr:hypothetical protein E4U19_007548 [Claviceps sp. Clav32 group G5]
MMFKMVLLKDVFPILVFLVALRLLKSQSAQWMIESIVTKLLQALNPVHDSLGKGIAGPRWQYLNGQTLDKFLNGREKVQEWQKYGSVYRIWAGTTPEIVITKPEDVRAFHADSSRHNKARSSNAGWLFHQLLGECMGLISGARWVKVRSEFESAFSHSAITMKAAEVSNDARCYVDKLEERRSSPFTVQAAEAVARFPFFCTATHLYGELSEEERNELWELGQRNLKMMGRVLSGGFYRFSIARWLYRSAVQDLESFLCDWTRFNERVYEKKVSCGAKTPIVSVWKKVMDGDLTREEAIHTLSEILFANLDVATGNLSWLVIYLAANEDIQRQVVEEISQHRHELDHYCARKDTLLAYCVLETLRLRPFTAFSIPESSPSQKVLHGFTVPGNTSVVVNTLAINYNAAFWGDKAEVFSPNRFHSINRLALRYNLFTFGMGTRKCLGSHFAEMMMKYFAMHLLNRFSLHIPVEKGRSEAQTEDTSMSTWVPISDKEVALQKRTMGLF